MRIFYKNNKAIYTLSQDQEKDLRITIRMIFKHNHLTQPFLQGKTIIAVDQNNPLVVVLSKTFTFMNEFVITTLSNCQVHFTTHYTDEQEIMSNHLPGIAFKDSFLSQQGLIEFLSDLMLQGQSFVNMNERRCLIKDQYRKWFGIIKEEHTGLGHRYYTSLSQLGIHSQQDYFNHLFGQFLSMASWVKGDILQRKYESFKRLQLNLETLFFYDVVRSILKLCDKTQVDHILRGHFENLIEFTQGFAQKIQVLKSKREQQVEHTVIHVVVDKVEQPPQVQYPKFRLNWRRFAITFTIATAIYAKWVE